MLGCRSRESGSDGLYLEHVLRLGNVLTAAQKARQCSTKSRDNTNFFVVDIPGTIPRTPVCIFRVVRPRTGPGGPDGRMRALVGVSVPGKGLKIDTVFDSLISLIQCTLIQ